MGKLDTAFAFKPAPSLKAVYYGREKRGKTYGMCQLASMAAKLMDLPGDIACIATESWVDDWCDRLSKASGKRIAVYETRDPKEALEFLQECEKSPHVSLVLIDCMTELQDQPRQAFVARTGKPMQYQHYATVDAPYKALVEYMRHARIHWIATAREADDKQETDGQEIIIGKEAKGKIGEVARLLVHCQRGRMKGGEVQFDWHVQDTAKNDVDRYQGKPTAAIWTPYLQRFIADKTNDAAKAGESRGSASRAKGARLELEMVKYLRGRRYAAARLRQFQKGGSDNPDVLACHFAGGRPLKIECKNRKGMPSQAVLDALGQAERAGEGLAMAVHRVERKPLRDAVVSMRLGDVLDLYEALAVKQASDTAEAVERELQQ